MLPIKVALCGVGYLVFVELLVVKHFEKFVCIKVPPGAFLAHTSDFVGVDCVKNIIV